MSRLVDADELIKNIKSYTGVFNNSGYYTRNDLIVKAINKTPIAYSVEAVVRELEKSTNGCGEIPLEVAIEIVRGGRNEV
jgi:hypothetical protein